MSDRDQVRPGRIEIAKQALNFSIGHFTIFSETERENLHGHNFQLECEVTAPIDVNGLMFDYGILKRALREVCERIDEQVILPGASPYLDIEQDDTYITACFAGERMPFLKRDVTILPVRNTSVEEFSWYFLEILKNHAELADKGIVALTVKISSGPGQFGVANWSNT